MHTFQHPQYDTDFCECRLCDTAFWSPYKALFISDGISSADLDIDVQHLKPGPNIERALDPNLHTSHSTFPGCFRCCHGWKVAQDL